jgi:hypothetical protein
MEFPNVLLQTMELSHEVGMRNRIAGDVFFVAKSLKVQFSDFDLEVVFTFSLFLSEGARARGKRWPWAGDGTEFVVGEFRVEILVIYGDGGGLFLVLVDEVGAIAGFSDRIRSSTWSALRGGGN